MCRIHIYIGSRPSGRAGSPDGPPAYDARHTTRFLCPRCMGEAPECDFCTGMAWQIRSRERWSETLQSQKQRLGKHLPTVDQKLSFDTFDIYLGELEERRRKRGLGRLFKPGTIDQLKQFTAAISTTSQVHDVTLLLWGSLQAILKASRSNQIAYEFIETMAAISDMLTDMTQQLPIFEEYRSIFPNAYELDEPLRRLYFYYVNFCIDTVLFLKSKRWRFVGRLTIRSVRKKFEDTRGEISRNTGNFKTQVDIARTRLGARADEHILRLTGANLRRQAVVEGIPFHRNFRFQNRDTVLEDLHRKLNPKSTPAVGAAADQTSCVIHGIGGVGKTQVALEYTYRYREDYAYIFWVRADSNIETLTSFASFARVLKPNAVAQDQLSNVKTVRDWMAQNDQWLLIFDNADDADLDLSLYWPPCSHGCIIITTQRRSVLHRTTSEIHLDTFEEDKGAELLLGVVESSSKMHPENFQLAKDISTELGGLPLLLSHVAGYVASTKTPLASVLFSLRRPTHFKRIWGYDSATSTNFQYGEPMAKVWRLALDSLKPEALRTLQIIAMLNPDEVYEDILFGDWEDPDMNYLAHGKHFEFNDLRQNLLDRHLVSVASDPGRTKLSIHRVLKRHILQLIDENEREDYFTIVFNRAVAMIRRQFPKAHELQTPTSATTVECEKCLPHILSLMTVYRDWAPKAQATYEFATLLADTGTNYMWQHGVTSDAIPVLEMGERICKSIATPEEIAPVHADICAIAGAVYEDIGFSGRATALEKCEEALKLRQKTIRAREARGNDVPPSTYLQLANAYNDVGVAKLSHGDASGALESLVESEKLKRQHKTEDELPWHYGELYKNLSFVKLFMGDLVDAEEHARRSCRLCCQDRADTEASTLKARFVLAMALMNVDKVDEALRLHKDVLQARKKLLGKSSLHTKNSLYQVGELYRFKGKLQKAEKTFREALQESELGWSTEGVARAKYHLALVIRTMADELTDSRKEEADKLVSDARRLRSKITTAYDENMSQAEEFRVFEYMAALWAGRWIGSMSSKAIEQVPADKSNVIPCSLADPRSHSSFTMAPARVEEPALSSYTANISFFNADHETFKREKPYVCLVPLTHAPPDFKQTNIEMVQHPMEVTNIRGSEGDYSLDIHGFQLVQHKPEFEHWHDGPRVVKEYYPYVVDCLKRELSAEQVFIYDHSLRLGDHLEAEERKRDIQGRPAILAHVDNTMSSAKAQIQQDFEEDAEPLLSGRFQIVNFWHPIAEPVLQQPLAFCDSRTAIADGFPADLVYPHLLNENMLIRHSPRQKWYFIDEQRIHEAWMFKIVDSSDDGGVAKFCPHTSFTIKDRRPEVTPLRQSIEFRAYVFYGKDE
ncbi:transcriptional xre family [Colletotrichum plurivorum]|uniref:Transcriptional xre family n=1 Tax=Colletotrichum plurivorum TaxID=2175906 RepID=A0A8H6NKA0_9PEZI|nr:transcriptional xre family [Colletotrichum plurivorum]